MKRRVVALAAGMLLIGLLLTGGCARGPTYVEPEARTSIDRAVIETPAGTQIKTMLTGLTAPCAICFVRELGEYDGALLIAESGVGGYRPRIYGFKRDQSYFQVYPRGQRVPTFGLVKGVDDIAGPIGGMVVYQGRIYVTHRDYKGWGMVSAFTFAGERETIVGGLPAKGDHSATDIAVHPSNGRLYFGLGSATNSGVVGMDNWQVGWVKRYPKFCDLPYVPLKLLGYRFDTPNPNAGIFGGSDIAVTTPFAPFGVSNQTRVAKAPDGKPTAAIYSVSPTGGDLRVEAHGIRLPRGLAFNEYASLFITNNGMEMRGTRPVKDDPDVLLKFLPGTWYGWPDFSADLYGIYEERYQPPPEIIQRTGFSENAYVIDHAASSLSSPTTFREQLLFGTFPSLSGAAKMDFVPSVGPFKEFRGSTVIALSGDRAPFASGTHPLKGPVGYKVVRVDPDEPQVHEFVRNTSGMPASKSRNMPESLERPIDAKFGPDGKLYILDFGHMEMKGGREQVARGSGRLFVVEPEVPPSTNMSENTNPSGWQIK